MRVRAFLGVALAFAVFAVPACHRHRNAEHAAGADGSISYGLGKEDADDRKDAAEKLREDGGPPPDAVPHLLKAVARETDDDAKEQMLITLGASGVPDARPILEANLNDKDKGVRKGAEKGLELWSKKSGQAVSPAVAKIARLSNAEWEVRRDAADDLGEHNGPPPEAVPPLVAAASRESHPKALSAMLITLGQSGAPEAKPVLDAHMDDQNSDIRRQARKAMKRWQVKNGQNVRRDVETKPPPAAPVAAATGAQPAPTAPSAPTGPDGCQQFKEICGSDPFDLDKCRADMKPLSYDQQVAWADCVNESSDRCQKAHATCMSKAKK